MNAKAFRQALFVQIDPWLQFRWRDEYRRVCCSVSVYVQLSREKCWSEDENQKRLSLVQGRSRCRAGGFLASRCGYASTGKLSTQDHVRSNETLNLCPYDRRYNVWSWIWCCSGCRWGGKMALTGNPALSLIQCTGRSGTYWSSRRSRIPLLQFQQWCAFKFAETTWLIFWRSASSSHIW